MVSIFLFLILKNNYYLFYFLSLEIKLILPHLYNATNYKKSFNLHQFKFKV